MNDNMRATMRTFLARFVLSTGQRGTLTLIARTSCDAVIQALDALDDAAVRCLSVRPM